VIADALWELGRRALTSWPLVVLGIAVVVLYFLGLDVIVLLFGGAAIVMVVRNAVRLRAGAVVLVPWLPFGAVAAVPGASLAGIFLEFLKFGAVVFGSGYVLLAFLRADLVEDLGWLTEDQLVDAVAIGQVTPGPVFTTATFVGYLVRGLPGALLATLGIFLPAFFFAAVIFGALPRLRRSPWANAFLDGVTVGGLGLMAGVTVQLGQEVIVDWFTAALAVVALVVLRRFQPNSAWLVLGGALIGGGARALGV
jgi:chromate transporter